MVVNDVLRKVRKDMVMNYFKMLIWRFNGGNEEN
jgi:hypothetical protein